MAGPGHNPTNPHPAPNKIDPIINLLSISLFSEIEKLVEKIGFSLFLNN